MLKKLWDKYKNLPIPVKASCWFFVCSFLQKAISFITTPIFTRLLSTSEYGQYNVFSSWLSILTVLITLNLYCGVYSSGLVRFEEDKKAFSSSLQGLTLTLITIWTIIYILFRDFWNNIFSLTTNQMLLMFLMIWTTVAFNFWSMGQRVDFKYKALVIVTIIVTLLKPVLGIILVIHAKDKVTARILGLAIAEVCGYAWCFFAQMIKGKVFFSKKYWIHALTFNIPLIPHYLSSSVLSSADRIMIGRMISESAAGIYGLAYSVSMIMTMFNTALMQTLEPWMYKKIKARHVEDISRVAYPSFILIAAVNLVLIAFAPEVIAIFAPAEYYDAIYVIPPVAMSVFFMFSYTFFAVFEFYYKKTTQITIATTAGAILNIGLNYIFLKLFGYYAAAYTTLICYMVYALAHYIFMRRVCNQELDGLKPYDPKVYFSIMLAFMTLGFLFLFTYSWPLLRYALILVICIILFVEREKCISAVIKILHTRNSD